MKKFTELLEKYLQPLSGKISSQKDLSAVAAGLARVTPLTIFRISVFSIGELSD